MCMADDFNASGGLKKKTEQNTDSEVEEELANALDDVELVDE